MATLVIAEHDHASLKGATLNTITAAVACGGEVHVLVAGSHAGAAAQQAAQVAGVAKVLHADDACLAHQLAENIASLVVGIARQYTHVLFPATANGKNAAPRVAALLDVAQISDITKVVAADTFERPIYAGNAIATVQSSDAIKVITVRSTGFDAAGASGGSAPIEALAGATDSGKSVYVGSELAKSIAPNSPPPRSSSPAVALWVRRRSSMKCSHPWPISSALHWAQAARRWMPAMRRMTGRWGRRARSWRLSCMWPAASAAPFSIWRA